MIFGDNYQKFLIFRSHDIWRYLVIFNDIWRYMTTETFTLETRKLSSRKYRQISLFIVQWETSFKTKYNELKKIENVLRILLKLVFSDKTIIRFWMKFMAINGVTDLKDYLFRSKKRMKRCLKTVSPPSYPPSLAKATLAA